MERRLRSTWAAGKWEKKAFKGTELAGKTLGLVGAGRIGRGVASRAAALGMTAVAYDPYVESAEGIEILPLDDVFARADYISLHIPHTEETHNIVNAETIAKMKTGARIINCGRGGIIDEDALYDAIVSGKIAGAALDVYAAEPSKGHKLYTLDQVIGSPHIGASTTEAQGRVGAEVAQNVIGVLAK